ncbi:MAG TPA: hypothetical protein VK629_05790 [Steroidobacteraceae bacterium]|nr:hypothetical protein [Steroidobacteraceae bacterium]
MNSKVDHLDTQHSLRWGDRLQDAVDGDLIASDLAAVSDHLGNCEACRSDYRALQALNNMLTLQIGTPALTANFDARVIAQVSTLAGSLLSQARELEQREHLARVAHLKRSWRSFWRFNLGNFLGCGAMVVAAFTALASGPGAQPIDRILQQWSFSSPFLLITAALAVTWALRGSERTQ